MKKKLIDASLWKFLLVGVANTLLSALLMFLLEGLGYWPSTAIAYVAGAVLSLTGMVLLRKTGLFSTVAVSVTGGVLHNVGQILMACLLLETNVIVYYLPFLILSGVIAGVVIGVVSAIMVNRVQVEC